jgi:hypothetical protein
MQGEQLLELCRATHEDLLLVAPFITPQSLSRTLDAVAPTVTVTLVTRWRPIEIARGFNSLENRDLVLRRPNGRFLLRHDLHAKYYAGDETALVGSANLTGAGLGWGPFANLELLVAVPRMAGNLADFEARLLSGAVAPDEQMIDNLQESIEAIGDAADVVPDDFRPPDSASARSIDDWVPGFASPDELWRVYQGDFSGVSSGGRERAEQDLEVLQLGRGLTRRQFRLVVRSTLEQMPLVLQINRLLQQGDQAHDSILAVLDERHPTSPDSLSSEQAYRILLAWFDEFLPGQYQVREARLPGMIGLHQGD